MKYSYQTSLKVLCLFIEDESMPKYLIAFNNNDYSEKLTNYCKTFLTPRIYYDNIENEIILPKILKIFQADFNFSDI